MSASPVPATGRGDRTRLTGRLRPFSFGSGYLIEYAQHETATLTKLAHYSHFILGFADAHGRATYYSKHFADGFTHADGA